MRLRHFKIWFGTKAAKIGAFGGNSSFWRGEEIIEELG